MPKCLTKMSRKMVGMIRPRMIMRIRSVIGTTRGIMRKMVSRMKKRSSIRCM